MLKIAIIRMNIWHLYVAVRKHNILYKLVYSLINTYIEAQGLFVENKEWETAPIYILYSSYIILTRLLIEYLEVCFVFLHVEYSEVNIKNWVYIYIYFFFLLLYKIKWYCGGYLTVAHICLGIFKVWRQNCLQH